MRVIRGPWTGLSLAVIVVSSLLVVGGGTPAAAATPPDPVVVPPAPYSFCAGEPWGVEGPCLESPVGGRVLNDVTARLIFWLPDGHSFAPGVPDGDARHMELVEQLFGDLSGSQTYNILTQYHDAWSATDVTRGYHPNRLRTETYLETRPFPQSPLTLADIQAEIVTASAAAGWPLRDPASLLHNLYFVFTPVGVQTCIEYAGCSGVLFAGLHDRFSVPVTGSTSDCTDYVPGECTLAAYAYIPTLGAGTSPPYPNNEFVDPVLDVTWHELAEAVSDPFGSGWQNGSSHPNAQTYFIEAADVCNAGFMPDGYGPRAADGSNIMLQGRPYLLQRIYSNAASGCTHAFHGQFINFRPLPAATTASPPFALSADATSTLPVSYAAAGACTVSGATVTVTGVGSCTITASQAGDRSAGGFYHPAAPVSQTFAVAYAPVSVATSSLPSTRVGEPSTTTLEHAGGVGPYSWRVASGALPPGLALGANGVLTGTGTAIGTYDFTVEVTDSHTAPTAATKALSITVGYPPSSVSIGDASVLEGDAGKRTLKLPVTLSAPSTTPVSVRYTLQAGSATAGAKAAAGVDVKQVSKTLTFKPAARTGMTPVVKTVAVPVFGDTVSEGNEDFHVVLADVSGGTFALGRSTGTGTILDDDASAGITAGVGDAGIVEGDMGKGGTLRVPVTLSAPAGSAVSIPFTISGGDASHGKTATGTADFGGRITGTVVFRVGKSGLTGVAAQIAVPIWADTRSESDESFTITLGAPTGPVTLVRSEGTGTIIADD